MKAKELPIESIDISDRARKDAGNIESLKESIEKTGLVQPVIVSTANKLIAGFRRIEAFKALGRNKIPCVISDKFDEIEKQLRAEIEENTCRLEMSITERLFQAERLRPFEEAEAKRREQAGKSADGSAGGRGRKKPKGNLPEGFQVPPKQSRDRIAAAVGMSGRTYEKAKTVAEAAESQPDKFGDLVAEMNRTGKVNGAFKKLHVEIQSEKLNSKPLPNPDGKFNVIVMDPPWKYSNREADPTHRASNPYPSMTIDEIKSIDVGTHAEDNCILWLWTTNSHLMHAWEIVEAWDFEYKTMLTWAKDKMGIGDWLRGQTEHCLLCIRGKPIVKSSNKTTLLNGKLREHSRKPDEFFKMVEDMCPGTKIEWFSRTKREGWQSYGNDTEKFAG